MLKWLSIITLQDYFVEEKWKFNQRTHTWLGVSFSLRTYMIKIILHRTDENKLDEHKYTKLIM